MVYAAVSKDLEGKSGTYISNCKEITAPALALKEEIQEELLKLSLKQVKLDNFFQRL